MFSRSFVRGNFFRVAAMAPRFRKTYCNGEYLKVLLPSLV